MLCSLYDRPPLMFALDYNDGSARCVSRRRHAAQVYDIAEFKATATLAISLMEEKPLKAGAAETARCERRANSCATECLA